MNRQRIVITALAATLLLAGCAGNRAFTQGASAARVGDWDTAVSRFAEAARGEPGNKDYRIELRRARFEASKEHVRRGSERLAARNCAAAADAFRTALTYEPTFEAASHGLSTALGCQEAEQEYEAGVAHLAAGREVLAREAFHRAIGRDPSHAGAAGKLKELARRADRTMMGPYEIRLSSANPITIRLVDASVREAFGVLSKLSGVNFLFDDEIKEKKVTLSLEGVRFTQALDMLCTMANVSRKAVSENTIIVYPNTPAKATQYTDHFIRTFVLSNTDAKQMANIVRSIVPVKKLIVNEGLNTIMARDDPEILALVQKIIEANDITDAEMMLDVEILEVDRSRLLDLGFELTPPAASGRISDGAAATSGTTEIPLSALKSLGPGNILLTLPSATLNLKSETSGTEILANPKIRVKNRGKARIHIGEKVPIITATTNQGVVTESIQYQDIGVKLDVEPWIHLDGEVSMKLRLEVSTLGPQVSGSQTVAYRIGARTTETELRLHDRETQIIGGLVNDEERTTTTRVPGLGDIPGLGRLFSSEDRSRVKTDILMSITPYILRPAAVPPRELSDIWSGKESAVSATRPSYEAPVDGDGRGGQSSVERQAAGGGAEPAGNPDASTVVAVRGPSEVYPGEEFDVGIAVEGGKGIHDVFVSLFFDSRHLTALSASEGDLLSAGGQPTTFSGNPTAAIGRVVVSQGRVGSAPGVDGDGTLFRVRFRATASGTVQIAARSASLRDDERNVLPARTVPLKVTIR